MGCQLTATRAGAAKPTELSARAGTAPAGIAFDGTDIWVTNLTNFRSGTVSKL